MTTIYSWISDATPDDYLSTLVRAKPHPDLDIRLDPSDPDYHKKLAEHDVKVRAHLAELNKKYEVEDAIDDARRDRLAEFGCDPDNLRGLALLPFEIAIYAIDRPDRMFTPSEFYVESEPIRALLEQEQRTSKDPNFSKAVRVREECEFLSQELGIGVSSLLYGKYTFGFGFLWDEDEEPPAIPHRFESMLIRLSDVQIVAEIQNRNKRDQEILEEQKRKTQAQLEKLAELNQHFIERNHKFLKDNVRNWRVPGV